MWWHGWLRHFAKDGRTRVRFPRGLLEFFFDIIPGVDSAPNRNENQGYLLGEKGGRCVGLTTLPLSGAPQGLSEKALFSSPIQGIS
jgi:hypothetical protein